MMISLVSRSQRFGGNPPSLKWNQMESSAARIIYPENRKMDAQRVLQIVAKMSHDTIGGIGNELKKIPIVLQTLPLVSNGYVGLAPWRSEFYMNPLQNGLELGSTNWIDNLAVHEFRHVHQFSNFRKGASKLLYLLAGQEGQSLANAATIPDWFFEGDAVYSETKYLGQGRGRLPYFFDTYHAIWNADKKYGYQKLRSGSLKDVVPNHYQLGYMLVAHGYEKFGDGFWGKVTSDAARFKGLIYPFQKAIKKHTGISYRQFVNDAMGSFRSQMPPEQNINKESALSKSNAKRVVDYLHPVWINQDTVLALRKPYNQLPHWVLLSNQQSIRIGLKFIGIDDYFNYKNGKIIYAGYTTDPRWDWKEFNDVYVFDVNDRSTVRITKNQRLFSPDISSDHQTMVAVEMPAAGGSVLQCWSLSDKSLLSTVSHPDGLMLSFPVFGDNDQMLYMVAKKTSGSSTLLLYDRIKKEFQELMPYVNAPIAFLRYKNQHLIFSITQSGRNEIWVYDLEQKKAARQSSVNTGSYAGDLDLDSKRIVYSRPTAEGDQLFTAGLNNKTFSEIKFHDVIPLHGVKFSHATSISQLPDSNFQIKPYKNAEGLVNIHSWRPYYDMPNWSFSIYGQNVLNTFQSTYQYVYNENERSHQLGAYATYGALFPWIVGGTNYTMNRNFKDSTRNLQWNEWNGNLGLRIPLSNNGGRVFRTVDFSSTLNNVFYNYEAASIPKSADKFISYLHLQLTASILSQQAIQQVNPRFGWTLNLQHRASFGKTDAKQSFAGMRIYLPGFMRTHSFNMSAAYQQRDTLRQYIYTNNFAMARGYAAFNYPRMWRFSFNYHLPVAYPDFGIAQIVYFRRIRSNLFFDDMHLKSLRTGRTIQLRSTGMEIHFDTKWWNQHPVSFGVRYSRLLDTKQFTDPPSANRWEIIMPVNLIPN
ncbi:MAG: hypothetical protein FJX88_02035 [Bacteroidetes bacterium]|nr:hypothetical protein [Bacteroidota bacterium]